MSGQMEDMIMSSRELRQPLVVELGCRGLNESVGNENNTAPRAKPLPGHLGRAPDKSLRNFGFTSLTSGLMP